MRHRPPLTALRAFDAAARHLSFARAAEELHVTPAALSFQIRSLEQELGQAVFERKPRRIELTKAGLALLPGIRDGFAAIDHAWRVAQRQDRNTLTVTAGPAFTTLWLAPRIFEFATAQPGTELRLQASLRLADLHRDDVDIAIRFGQHADASLHSIDLSEEWLTPVMSPSIGERFSTLASLVDAPLLHDDSIDFIEPRCDWPAWFRRVGIEREADGGTRFSQADHAVNAAVAGAGVLLGRLTLVGNLLAEGRLVAPFGVALASSARFRLVCLAGREEEADIAAFVEWLRQQMVGLDSLREGFDV